ncbi:hypothetical protein [Streptomyces sp. DH24]|uniref:hypothetical protein n=1 Tax=Streptomyces sp. DH24 TaxID=3040123 RepID=UPI0024431246|nr:hypothetical protein [Streptomyces sp. DH24]MDG9717462.1 hypothetical protein [Streptomyces sp. DH24]
MSRRPLRAAAAGLAGALALTACSDGGDGGGADKASDTPSASAPAGDGDGGASDGASASATPGGLEGSWLATTDGKAVALVINGTQAGLFATGGTVCSGTAEEQSIRLKCADGDKDRSNGTVGTVNATKLTVTWQGTLGEETYTRSEGGKLPTGLPTAGLGS